MERDHIAAKVLGYAKFIIDKELPSNISIHAGGVLITEKPIYAYTATELPPKGYPVSQFEMHAAEDFGIYKFDILSQRGLATSKKQWNKWSATRHRHQCIRIQEIQARWKDQRPDAQQQGHGCFYVESPATRMLLGKLRCDEYLTLVAASSIIYVRRGEFGHDESVYRTVSCSSQWKNL